jgi:hypothetical protein
MKKISFILFFFFMIYITPAIAFSDDFSSGTITQWTLVTGSWSASDYNLTNTGASSPEAYANIGSGQKYISFTWNVPDAGTTTVYWSGTSKGLQYASGSISGVGFTITGVTIPAGDRNFDLNFTVDMTTSGQLHFTVRYPNGTLYPNGDQIVSYTWAATDSFRIKTTSGTYINYFDNIYTYAVAPSSSNSITTNLNSYTVNSTVTINWVIDNSDWTWYNSFDIQVQNIGLPIDTLDVGSQTGVYFYQPPTMGAYQLNLRKFYLGILSSTIATTNFTVYPEGQSSLMIDPQIPVGKNFNLNYTFGFTPDCGSNLCIIKAMHLNKDGSYTYEKGFTATGTLAGTMYSTTGNVNNEGTYLFQFYYGGRLLDSKTATANYIYMPGEISLSASYINLTKTTFAMGETMIGDFGVDNANYSSKTIYLEFYNWDKMTNTTDIYCNPENQYGLSFPCKQAGSFSVDLDNTLYGSGFNEQLSSMFFIAGNNKVALMGKNATAITELAHINFTLGSTNTAGYGLVPSTNSVCIGSPVRYQIITPGPATFVIYDGLYQVLNYSINGSQVITYTPSSTIGSYGYTPTSETAKLFNSNGYIEASANLEVKNCGAGATPGPTLNGESTISFLSSQEFITIIIFFTIVGMLTAYAGIAGLFVGTLATIPVMYIANLVPIWLVFLDAGIVFLGIAVVGVSYITKNG